jgi:RND family efflux transporter MFP subunit
MVRQGVMTSPRETAFEVMVALADERQAGRKGRLDFVDNRMDQATGTMRARAVFDNKDLLLSPGLFGRIQVPASGKYRGVLVPDEAIGADQDRRIVYVVAADGKVTPTVVRPGPRIDGYRVVRSGLTGDETIIVGGVQRVRFSDRVTPQMTSLAPSR